jgi:V8-like Glu-specific endopeptidase
VSTKKRLSTDYTGDVESPFLDEELFVGESEEEWEPRVAALEAESPFKSALEEGQGPFDSAEMEEPVADTAELQPVEEERLGGNEEPTSELSVGKREQADAFADREAEDDPGRLELEQGITGEDDRVEVADTTVAPYRWICSVTYEKGGATLDGGSGVLISDRHVLTAGHVIKEAGSGPDAPSLVIYPGRHYGGEPFGRYLASRTRLPNFNMDFGLITLTRPVDPALLWWGHPSTNTDWWSDAAIPLRQLRQTALPITTAGFPGAKDAYRRRMYEARGETVPARFGGVFRHTADTTRGQSGSPIWTERQGRRILIGLVTAFDELPNQIAVFAHDNLMQRVLRQWMAQDAPRPPRVERRIALEIPYRWACRLEVYDNDLRRTVGYGSGLLISNQHVLTSARVIHEFVQDRRRYAVSVAPGYEFGKEAFGSTTAAKGRTSPRFSLDSKDASAEFGLLTLSRALGTASFAAIKNAALGSWGGANYGIVSSAADWSGKPAHIAAFSRSAGGGGAYQKLRVSSGGFVGLTSGQILHRAGSKLDAPGAPLWVEAGDRRLLVGIATTVFSKDSEVNWGCYLSEEAQSHLRQWMNEDFESHETEAGDRFSQDETEIFAAEGGAEPGPQGVKAADESDDLSDMERGSDQEVEDGMAGHAPAEWAMEWAEEKDESPLTWAGAVEEEEDARLEYDTPPMTQAISDAADQKDWPRLLTLAMQVGWHDENQLTNLLFYSRHPELDRRKLDPQKNKGDRSLADEWKDILIKEVRPAIRKAAEDSTLEVRGNLVAERDPELSGENGAKFRELVAWAASEVAMDPGFLAAVLLAEVGRASPYLSTGEVRSFFTGTDDFFTQQAQLRANVPAFAKVHFDEKKKKTNINEHGREVTTIPYRTGRDAALATAVYLKWGEIKLRRAMQKNGGDFGALPVATQFVLVRVAMAAGHGGISPDGDLIRFKKKGDALVPAKPGESSGILLGVARSLDRVLKGEDILVRNWEPRQDPTNDSHITHRNATILASQAIHLGDWFFRAQPLGIQPELEESGLYQSNAAENEWQETSPAVTKESDEFADQLFESEAYPEPLMEELVAAVSQSDLRKRIDEYFDLANAEYTLPDGNKVRARSQFHIASVGNPEEDAERIEKLFEKKFGAKFSRPLHTPIRCAAYGRARPEEIQVISQHLIDAGEVDPVRADNPGFSGEQLVRALQRKFNVGIDCAGYVQLAFIYAFTGEHDAAVCNLRSSKLREDLGLKAKRSDENLADLPAKHFAEVGFLNGQTGDLLVLARRKGERDWHTVIVVDHTVSGDVHTLLVDASWGFLYGTDAAGVARRKLAFDKSTGKWWDIHPIDGTKVNENSIGPYRGHPIKGMYRGRQK